MSTTFAFVTFAWVFFRYDDDVHSALGYIKHIGVSIIDYPTQLLMLPVGKMAFVYIIPLVIGDWYLRRDERIISVTKYKSIRILVYYIILIAILMFIKNINSSFIYFQF
jgi:hypothetical protein